MACRLARSQLQLLCFISMLGFGRAVKSDAMILVREHRLFFDAGYLSTAAEPTIQLVSCSSFRIFAERTLSSVLFAELHLVLTQSLRLQSRSVLALAAKYHRCVLQKRVWLFVSATLPFPDCPTQSKPWFVLAPDLEAGVHKYPGSRRRDC
jgi:hypothetical protein